MSGENVRQRQIIRSGQRLQRSLHHRMLEPILTEREAVHCEEDHILFAVQTAFMGLANSLIHSQLRECRQWKACLSHRHANQPPFSDALLTVPDSANLPAGQREQRAWRVDDVISYTFRW
ncbi:hypothetical protein CBM2608_B80002 [Cupriavidus taiwanensis]|nr:hypothetical protein CBM2588_B90130 [Cupriavidus taiwanensis]SOZ31425.1 hypothetical protein CBM2608_B80002 [Cupriavidus taiwanensis]SOZ67741.1 hypothetical protein CBM2617_B110128 [Cupriavidus taiwanensis]SOZ87605.1 hypothetical protein CBM2622_B120127 [Cupriavidus taiwanensis]SOZ93682.1 hypothetical protein CBM2621_B120015 [Cupriavidus taiwanensis]